MNNKLKEVLEKGKPSELQISEVHRIVSLIQKVNCSTFALVTETASELGIKKTALMQYIEDNPKLFDVTKATSKSAKGVVKSLGLAIWKVYLTPEENPDTEEWLEIQKKAWERKIQVFGKYYYDVLEFHYIEADDPKDRKSLYRNTPEKIQTLVDAGLIKKVSTCYGGIGDCYNWEGYKLDIKSVNAIKEAGWELVYPSLGSWASSAD